MCNLGSRLRWAYLCVSLVVDWSDPERVEKIAADRERAPYIEAGVGGVGGTLAGM